MKLCGIYLITHVATGRKYVGQSIDIHKRWQVHARGKCQMHLGRSIAAHGWDAFTKEVIEICERPLLNDAEAKWVAFHECVSPDGFNLTYGGKQHTLSAESKAKMSAVRTGKKFSEECKENMRVAQLNRSDEWAAKITASKIGRKFSEETKAKIGAAKKGQRHTEASKAKMSAARKGKVRSQETCEKLSIALKGRIFSEETKAKMSASQKGKKLNPESLAKRTATNARIFAEKKLLRQNAAIAATRHQPPQIL